MLKGHRPDLTLAQIVAVVGAAIGVAVAFGAHLTQHESDAIVDLVKVLAPTIVGADFGIRSARNYRDARRGDAEPLPPASERVHSGTRASA